MRRTARSGTCTTPGFRPIVDLDYGHVVALADDAPGFAEECVRLLDEGSASRPDVDAALHRQHWDTIAASMEALMTRHLVTPDRTEASA